jgi:hypothetical protein
MDVDELDVTDKPRLGGGASPGYHLRRCDEEHGEIPCSESIGQPALGSRNKKAVNGTFLGIKSRGLHPFK